MDSECLCNGAISNIQMHHMSEIERKDCSSEDGTFTTGKMHTEAAPFGVDMFGPFIIKQRRSEIKRYCALFTCFSSCTMHIGVTSSLDPDSSILDLGKLMPRRSLVNMIRQ